MEVERLKSQTSRGVQVFSWDHVTAAVCGCRRPIGSTIAIAPSDDVFDILPTELSTRVGAQTFK
jgi:hypothetical protein